MRWDFILFFASLVMIYLGDWALYIGVGGLVVSVLHGILKSIANRQTQQMIITIGLVISGTAFIGLSAFALRPTWFGLRVETISSPPAERSNGTSSATSQTTPQDIQELTTAKYRLEHDLPRLTLYDLFKTDFGGSQKMIKSFQITNNRTKKTIKIWISVVVDLERANKIVLIYIPYANDTDALCSQALNLIPNVLKFSDIITMTQKLGTAIASSKDAQFSKTVFIYNETDLGAEEVGQITALYRENGYRVSFRDSSYLMTRKLQASSAH